MEKSVYDEVAEAIVCAVTDLTDDGAIDGEYTIKGASCGAGLTGQACAAAGFDKVKDVTGEIVAVFGPVDTLLADNVHKAILASATKPLLLSPATHVAAERQWDADATTIFSSMDLRTELIAQVNYVKATTVPSSVLVVAFAADEATKATVTDVFTDAYRGHGTLTFSFVDEAQMNVQRPDEIKDLNTIVGTYCDTVFLVGQPTYYAATVLAALWPQPQLKLVVAPVATTLLVRDALGPLVTGSGADALKGRQFIFTSSFPFPRLETGARNPGAVTKYLASQCGGKAGAAKPSTQALRFHAWMSVYALVQMLRRYPSTTAAPFVADMQQLNLFTLADLPFGDLAGDRTNAIDTDHFSFCDQGSRRVYYGTARVTATGWDFVPLSGKADTAFALPYDICSMQREPLYYPIPLSLYTSLNGESGGSNDALIENFMAGASSGWGGDEYRHLQRHQLIRPVTGSSTTPLVTNYIPDTQSIYAGPLFVDAFRYPVSLNTLHANELHFLPTLEQQVLVVVQYFAERAAEDAQLGTRAQRKLEFIIRRAGVAASTSAAALSDAITQIVEAVLTGERKELLSHVNVSDQRGATGLKPADGATDVVVLGGFDAKAGGAELHALLRANANTNLYIPFEEYSMFYTALTAPKDGEQSVPALLGRVHFVTNVMRPTAAATRRTRGARAGALLANHPLFERGNMSAAVIDALAKLTAKPAPTVAEMAAALYDGEYLAAHGTVFGPYSNTCGAAKVTSKCLVNYGARNLNLWTHPAFVGGGAPVFKAKNAVVPIDVDNGEDSSSSAGGSGGSSEGSGGGGDGGDGGSKGKDDKSSPLSTGLIIAVAVAGFVVILLLVLLVLLCCCCRRTNSRNNKNAPKDPNAAVTLIFTDIESSTALWATVPTHMAKAVKAHHKVMREVISKHGCYEVKTIGDSFMIACHSAAVAVALAAEAQERLHALNWGTDEIDGAYRTLAAAKARKAAAKGGAGVLDPDWALPPEEYARRWNGLRVRIGMHTGLCDAVLDEVTRRYDYYGTTVNVAARTEALGQGGQVLCTEATHAALTPDDAAPFEFTYVGAHPLRGVTEPVGMYQLATVPGRQFVMDEPAAAVDAKAEARTALRCQGELLRMEDCTSDQEEEGSVPDVTGEMAYEVLEFYFSTYSAKERGRLLAQTCKHLSIEPPRRRNYKDANAWMEAMTLLLASRTTAVIEYRKQAEVTEQEVADDEPGTTSNLTDNGESAVISSPTSGSRLRLYGLPPMLRTSQSANPLVPPNDCGFSSVSKSSAVQTRLSARPTENDCARSARPVPYLTLQRQKEMQSVYSRVREMEDDSDATLTDRRSSVAGSARRASKSAAALVFDTGDVVELLGNENERGDATSPARAFRRIRSDVRARSSGARTPTNADKDDDEPIFQHGSPTINFDRAVSCVTTAGGKIFRLTNDERSLWAFYNDTAEYKVVVAVSIGKKSEIISTGPELTLTTNPETGRLEGEMVVYPLQTQVMLHGTVKGFKLHYSIFTSEVL